MSTDRHTPPLPGSSRDQHPNIGILLRDLHHDVVQRVTTGLADAGFEDIRTAHTSVFQHINAEGSRLTELAQRAQITKQSMGYLVDYLEKHGYVERHPDASDRRVSLIHLTERGWNEVQAALAIIAEVENEWARRLGKTRMRELRRALTDLRPPQPA
jgi:DNA-binding MarR family transcriptional regulator